MTTIKYIYAILLLLWWTMVVIAFRPFGAQIRPFLEMMQGAGGAGGHSIRELQQ